MRTTYVPSGKSGVPLATTLAVSVSRNVKVLVVALTISDPGAWCAKAFPAGGVPAVCVSVCYTVRTGEQQADVGDKRIPISLEHNT